MKPHASVIVPLLTSLFCSWALVACGGSGSSSATTTATATAVTVPGQPTLNAATAGDGLAMLSFSAPASDGGASITSYLGACTAGGSSTPVTATGTASPLAVTGLTNGTAYTCTVAATNSAGTGSASASTSVTPVASPTAGSSAIDTTKLPLGDSYVVNTAPSSSAKGYLYVCPGTTSANGPGTTTQGPWFNSDGTTWSLDTKILYAVNGAVAWTSSFATSVASNLRSLSGNGLPNHTTGIYPITEATSPEAYTYDRNGNSIVANTVAWTGLPTSPTANATPTCVGGGAIGVFLTGARLFAAMDAKGRDARAWELGDDCGGHPAPGGAYHYHSLPKCGLDADVPGQHSALVAYVADGFGLYGKLGENGVEVTNDDLDECHGHTDSTRGYHYHTTETFPYTVGCYRGTPIAAHQ